MNREKITQLRQLIIKQLCPLINNDYVLLDIPNHSNIGDNLIWEGELLFLKQNLSQYNMRYSANFINCDLSNVSSNDIILMHGGGNWGDLYPACQNLRVKVVKKFPHNRIIIFPQTVFYNDKSKLKLECSVFNSHSDIHICLRDEVSYNILKEYISEDKLLLLPDMAFFIDIQSEKKSHHRKLFLKRTDQEASDLSFYNLDNSSFDILDWPTYFNSVILNKYMYYPITFQRLLSIFLQKVPVLSKLVSPVYGLNSRHNREKYIKMGIDFFSKYDAIYTTRLHGLILAILMNKKIYLLDNNYGKIKNFYNTWLKDFEGITILNGGGF